MALPGIVRIGGMTKSALLSELGRRGVRLNEIGLALFAHPGFSTSGEKSSLLIVDTSVADLGHARGATIAKVFATARARGWGLCPLEVAPYLRKQFMDQSEGECGQPPSEHRAPAGAITVASQPLLADDGSPMGFYLRRIRGVDWLRGYRSPAEHVWSPDDRFIFCEPAR